MGGGLEMAKMGRPVKKEIDLEFLKKLIDKGFTIDESSKILNVPIDTMQYWVRTRNLGKFARYKKGFYDDAIRQAVRECQGNITLAAKHLGLKQPHVHLRYNNLVIFDIKKEERYKWLKKYYPEVYANVVAKN